MELEEKYAKAVAALRTLAERGERRYMNIPSDRYGSDYNEGYQDGEYSCACEAREVLETLGESVK